MTGGGGPVLEKRERMNYLSDFYGELLTPRQQQILDLYYNHDLSLGEISSETRISRQAAHDILKRSEGTLERLEGKLGLYRRFLKQQEELTAALTLLEEEKRQPGPESPALQEAIDRIRTLLE